MNNNYLTISENIANRFFELYPNLEAIENEITVSGIGHEKQIKVHDYMVNITKIRFFELNNLKMTDENHDINKIWTDLKNHQHERILETLITDCIRKQQILCDCTFIRLIAEDKFCFHFRHDAEFITQKPTSFNPLYRGSFDLMHEVIQGEYAITTANSNKPVLATWHLAECVAFVAYEHFSKIGILAHIDPCTNIVDFFDKLKQNFKVINSKTIEIDYILIGGRKEFNNSNHRGNIINTAEKANDQFIKFRLINQLGDLISPDYFLNDSYWGVSFRLSRSVSLDMRKDNPLLNLESYEAGLNKDSSLHKRTGDYFEALNFELKREREKVLTLSYDGTLENS